jgi:predicted GNAT family acetyltransferase
MVAMDLTVVDNEQRRRFEAIDEAAVAGFMVYRRRSDAVVITHTEVDGAYEGQGVGSRLVRGGLDQIRAEGLLVVPECPFVRRFLSRHWDDYADIVVGMAPPSA